MVNGWTFLPGEKKYRRNVYAKSESLRNFLSLVTAKYQELGRWFYSVAVTLMICVQCLYQMFYSLFPGAAGPGKRRN